MQNWYIYGAVGIGVTLAIGYFVWMINVISEALISAYVERKSIQEFREDLEGAVLNSQPNWDSIRRIALTRGLKPYQIYPTLEEYIRDIKSGRNENLVPHLDLLEGYVDAYRHEEPFQSLPSDIRLHLERIRDRINEVEPLEPLTVQIKDLLSIHTAEKKKAKFYTVGGFVFGVVGVAIAIFPYVNPPESSSYEQKNPQEEIRQTQNENANK